MIYTAKNRFLSILTHPEFAVKLTFSVARFSGMRSQEPEDRPAEDRRQPGVVQARDPVEYPGPVDPSLHHQEMLVGVELGPVSEGLDGGDDPGDESPRPLSGRPERRSGGGRPLGRERQSQVTEQRGQIIGSTS
jgi:hypothetical protein